MLPRMLTLLVVCLFASLFTQDPSKPLYSPTGQEATLVGSVTVEGETDRPWQIDMSADPVCTNLSPRLIEWVTRNGDKLQNVFVYFKSGDALTQYAFTQPTTPAVLKHKNCFYRPRILGIRVNQPIEIENDDPTTHNTHPTPKLNREWNYSQMAGGARLVKTFARPEVPIPFKCNQHPWEKAYVGVFSHPFFAISDMFGRFEIRGVPPGSYKLVAWHEKLGEQEIDITLVPGEVRHLDLTFKGDAK